MTTCKDRQRQEIKDLQDEVLEELEEANRITQIYVRARVLAAVESTYLKMKEAEDA